MLTLVAQTLTHSVDSLGVWCTHENTPHIQSCTHMYLNIALTPPCSLFTRDVLSLLVQHCRAASVKFPAALLTGFDIEALSRGSLLNGLAEGRIRREIWGDRHQGKSERERESAIEESDFYQWACNNWERWVQWQPVPSGMETAVYTVYRMGYQLRYSIGTGTDRVIWLDWFQLSLRWQ